MDISVIRPTELGQAEIQAWHSLLRKSSSLNSPYLCPEFAVGVAQFQPAARVAVITEGSAIAGFFPFERRRFGAGVAIGGILSNCQGLIYSPDSQWDVRALLKGCKLATWKFDKLIQDQEPFERYAEGRVPAAVIDLTDGFEAYREGFKLRSSKFLKNLNRKINKLDNDCGEIRLVADSRDLADLRTLMSWKSEQCRQNGWLDVFERPWVVGMIDRMFGTRTDMFSSVLSMLYVGDIPAAAMLCLRSEGFLAGWYTAYNPKFAQYSPGIILFIKAAEELADAGIRTLEFGGTDFYQEKIKNKDIYYTCGVAAASTFAAGAFRAQARSEDWARQQIKRFPFAYRAADGVLKRMGRIA